MALMISREIMKTISDFKIFNNINLFTRTCFIFFLGILYLPSASAENIQNLQQNASIAYEQMMQAKRSAETLAKDVAFAERKLASIKQKLSVAEQEVAIARKKSEQAKISMEQAINRWKQATDTLANEWGNTERK